MPDLPIQFEPVLVPDLALYTWGIIFFTLFAVAFRSEWRRAGKNRKQQ